MTGNILHGGQRTTRQRRGGRTAAILSTAAALLAALVAVGAPASASPRPIRLLEGAGAAPSFVPAVPRDTATGALADFIAAGDMNGDGKTDIVSVGPVVDSGSSGSFVSVLLGNGDGTFRSPPVRDFAVGFQSTSVALGDLNHDNLLDAVVANISGGVPSSYSVSILLGNGDGTLTPTSPRDLAVGDAPRRALLADLNGDGDLDIVTDNYRAADISVLLGNGDGSFVPMTPREFAVGSRPLSLALGDMNGDGKVDAVTPNDVGNSVSIVLGTGGGGFVPALPRDTFLGVGPFSVAVGDVNGDGVLDVVSGNRSGSISVLLGNGDGTVTAASPRETAVAGGTVFGVMLADLNADGRLDVITATPDSNTLSVLLGNGDGTFGAAVPRDLATGNKPFWVVAADLNADSRPDLISANYTAATVSVLLNVTNRAPVAVANGPYRVAVGQQITFNSAGSSDPDGDALTALWTAGGGMVFGNTFTAGQVVGVYDVGLVVNDGQMNSAPVATSVVVFNPNGGFVTGGGWIKPSTGKATFSLSAQYATGASVPTGSVQFAVGNVSFASTNLQWLVVNGARAQFSGEGTLNGVGRYGFTLTVIDGQVAGGGGVDKFRIKIWDIDNGDTVVYDNQPGALDSAAPTTRLGGGNIVIHNTK